MRPAMWTRIVCSLVALAWFGLAEAQYYRHAKPLPPRGLKIDAAALAAQPSAASPWQPVKSPPPFPPNECNGFGAFPGGGNPLLLTDGTVIIQDAGCPDWVRLTPDSSGSYANGTWTQIASLPAGYSPLYHSSAVLPDGRVIIMGGDTITTRAFTLSPSGRPKARSTIRSRTCGHPSRHRHSSTSWRRRSLLP